MVCANTFENEKIKIYVNSTFLTIKESKVNLVIYDLKGSQIKSLVNSFQSPGVKNIIWHGDNGLGELQPAGLYIIVFKTKEFYDSKKMILLK